MTVEAIGMQITINDRTVQAESGDTIFMAAARGGIRIPSLCASAHLSPYGSCRLCLGEIVGLAGLHATCSMPVRDGMVVRTESETLARSCIFQRVSTRHPPKSSRYLRRLMVSRACVIPPERHARRYATNQVLFLLSITPDAFRARAVYELAMRSSRHLLYQWWARVLPCALPGVAAVSPAAATSLRLPASRAAPA